MKKHSSLFYLLLAACASLLVPLDRYFFKRNGSFTIRFLSTTMPNRAEWDIAPPTQDTETLLDSLLAKPFTYFAKGAHCYAFLSHDGNYIIKFHRYPSHMRPMPWLTHPFSYHFNKRRIAIKKYNLENYVYYMNNYKTSFEDLQEETGLVYVHINRTKNLKKRIVLIDKSQNRYDLALDDFTFIIQRRAELIYPTLERYVSAGNMEKAKETITQIFSLITTSVQKGYINNDPVLKRNYGLMPDRAIYIDIGDLERKESPITVTPSYLLEITQDLRAWATCYPPLLEHYNSLTTNY